MSETPDKRETFTETLATVAETGRDHMRPFPVASVVALSRRRRRQRSLAVLSLAATTSAVALGLTLGIGTAGKAAPVPPVGSTPTHARSATPAPTHSPTPRNPLAGPPLPAEFLAPGELPDASRFPWFEGYARPLGFLEPLPSTCGKSLGAEDTRGVLTVRYPSNNNPQGVQETIYTYDTDSHAADRLAKLTPTCDSARLSVHTADGFGWAEPVAEYNETHHLVVARRGAKIAVVEYIQAIGYHYDATQDAAVLAAMLDHLAAVDAPNPAFLTPAQIPFPDDSPWLEPSPDIHPDTVPVTDTCQRADNPVNTLPDVGPPLPRQTTQRFWAPGNTTDVSPATEWIHVYGSADDAKAEYQRTRTLHVVQTCRFTKDQYTIGEIARAITPGGTIAVDGSDGFAISASDTHVGGQDDGTVNHYRTYVVLNGDKLAVLVVPVTKEHAGGALGDLQTDTETLMAIFAHLR